MMPDGTVSGVEEDTAALRPRKQSSVRTPAKRLRRFALRCCAAGALLLLVWCGTLFAVIMRYDGQPADGALRHADVGIVLGASLWDDKPSPGLQERIDYALSLYRAGAFDRFLVTGGLDSNGATITEAEGMRNYLLAQGVPGDAIVLETKARSTLENLKFSQEIMRSHGWETSVIITHQYHGARAADIAKALRYDPVQVSVTDSKVLPMPYVRTREVLAYTKWLGEKWLLHAA